MNFATIRVTSEERGIATLTLNRPEKHNSLDSAMIRELTEAFGILAEDHAVRAVVLTGAGRSFCAGGDLGWMRDQLTAGREERVEAAGTLARMLQLANALPKPLIGKVQGQAFGGGVGIMAVCDVVIAASGARFGLTEVRFGLIPATISPYVVARLGEPVSRRLFMSARLFGAAEAKDIGLVAEVVEPEQLDEAVETEVRHYLAASPVAVAAAKALARSLGPRIDAAVVDATIGQLADVWETPDAHEGITAFLEKRKARFAR